MFRSKKQKTQAFAAAMACGVLLSYSTATASADTGLTAMTGTLVSPAGDPVAGAIVEASVEPSAQDLADLPAGAEVSTVPIGTATTAATGAFALRVTDFRPVAQAADDESVVSIMLSAETPQGQLLYRVRMLFTAPDKLAAYQPDVESDVESPDASRSRLVGVGVDGSPVLALVTTQVTPNQVVVPSTPANPGLPGQGDPRPPKPPDCKKTDSCTYPHDSDETTPAGPVDDDSEVEEPEGDYDVEEPAQIDEPRTDVPVYNPPTLTARVKESGLSAQAAAARGSYDPQAWCGGNHWYRVKSKHVVTRNIGIMDQATGAKTTGKFKYETTKKTSLEIGVTNRAGALSTTLGMTKGKSVTASVESTIKRNVKAQWWIGYDFSIFDFWCQSNTTYNKWWSGYSEYRPKEFSGDSSRRNWAVFTCDSRYRSTLGDGYTATVAKGRTSTKTGAFAFGNSSAGNLKVTQEWGSTASVSYVAINSDASYVLCGAGGKWPTGVSRTRQM